MLKNFGLTLRDFPWFNKTLNDYANFHFGNFVVATAFKPCFYFNCFSKDDFSNKKDDCSKIFLKNVLKLWLKSISFNK